jgi:hypothetical protein
MSRDFLANRVETRYMRASAIAALLGAFVIAGCAGVKSPPAGAAPPAMSEVPAPTTAAPAQAAAPPPQPTPQPAAQNQATAARPASPPSSPPATASQSATKPDATAAKAPAKAPAPKAPGAQAPQKEIAAPQVAAAKPPTLDLKSLEERLKDTSAIGVLTKLALKNQVDDLLNQFRAYYQGKLKTTLAELRRPYDLLVLKVLSLLQDSDPALASAIASSREAIWGILADPAKFATVA